MGDESEEVVMSVQRPRRAMSPRRTKLLERCLGGRWGGGGTVHEDGFGHVVCVVASEDVVDSQRS